MQRMATKLNQRNLIFQAKHQYTLMVIRSCMVCYSLVLIIEARRPRPFIDTSRNERVQGTRPLMIEPKQLISIKSRPKPLAWIKRGTEKPYPRPFDLLCCLLRVYWKYSNRAVTIIQQSCISITLIEQSSRTYSLYYYKKTKQTNTIILKGSRDLIKR